MVLLPRARSNLVVSQSVVIWLIISVVSRHFNLTSRRWRAFVYLNTVVLYNFDYKIYEHSGYSVDIKKWKFQVASLTILKIPKSRTLLLGVCCCVWPYAPLYYLTVPQRLNSFRFKITVESERLKSDFDHISFVSAFRKFWLSKNQYTIIAA